MTKNTHMSTQMSDLNRSSRHVELIMILDFNDLTSPVDTVQSYL